MSQKISHERAGEIAYKIVRKVVFGKDGTRLDKEMRDMLTDVSKESNIELGTLRQFVASNILPYTVKKMFDWDSIGFTGKLVDNTTAGQCAMAILTYKIKEGGIPLGPDRKSETRKISELTGISHEELNLFIATYLLPIAVGRFLGIEGWQIRPGEKTESE